jgi:hypothetical protein
MANIDSNLECPNCAQVLRPVQLICDSCGIKVEGPFRLNEFATLAPDDLHFLRIFVRCEGRIREMEAALGLSYPTIRSRLTALKTTLQGEAAAPVAGQPGEASEGAIEKILQRLQAGEIPFDDAMNQIKQARSTARKEES